MGMKFKAPGVGDLMEPVEDGTYLAAVKKVFGKEDMGKVNIFFIWTIREEDSNEYGRDVFQAFIDLENPDMDFGRENLAQTLKALDVELVDDSFDEDDVIGCEGLITVKQRIDENTGEVRVGVNRVAAPPK